MGGGIVERKIASHILTGSVMRTVFSSCLVWSLVILLALSSVMRGDAAGAPAALATGNVHVLVVEDIAKRPVPRSVVRIVSDERVYDGIANKDGSVDFAGVAPGVYGINVSAADFEFTRDYVLTVRVGETQTVTVVGKRTGPRRIGSVRTKASPPPSGARAVGDQDAAAQIASDVGSAIRFVPSIGNDGFGGLSINNQGAGQTAVTINGSPIFGSGSSTQLGLFSSDAFSSAGVDAGDVGAPGGTLDFRSYDPTIDWGGIAKQRGASFGSVASSVQVRGTTGRLGIAVTHSVTDATTRIDGRALLDTSGAFYTHATASRNTTDFTTLRYGYDANHVGLLDYGRIEKHDPLICTFQSGPLPCGYGPGNGSTTTVEFAQYRDQRTLDRANLEVHVFASRSTSGFDNSAQTIEGTLIGGAAGSTVLDRIGVVASLGFPITQQHSATLTLQSTHDAATILGAAAQRGPIPLPATSLSSAKLVVPLLTRRRFDISLQGGINGGYGTTQPIVGGETNYQLTKRDSLRATYANGTLPSKTATFPGTSLAETVQPDCNTGRALFGGPSFVGDTGTASNLRASFNHVGDGYSLSIDGFRNNATNASVSAALPGNALGSLALTPGFYARAGQIASLECANPLLLSGQNSYFTTNASVGSQLSDGLNIGAQFDVTPRGKLTISYALARARAFGSSILFAPGSNLIPGDQLPGRPLARYSIQGKAAVSRATTLLVSARGLSANNPYGSRAIFDVDAGVRVRVNAADIVASVQNVGNAHGSAFTGFAPFPQLAQPFLPRTYGVTMRLALGRQNIDRADNLSPGFNLSGGFSFEPLEFEPRPTAGWLAPRTDTPLCSPEKLLAAKPYEDAVDAYVKSVGAAAVRGQDPRAVAPLQYEALTMRAVTSGASPSFELSFASGRARSFGSFFTCDRIHDDTIDKAKKLGVYAPGWREREDRSREFRVYYSEQIGLYFAPEPFNDDNSYSRSWKPGFSSRKGDARFTVLETACPPRSRQVVQEAATALQRYVDAFYGGRHPISPEGFAISPHVAKSETWLEVRADDRAFASKLEDCLDMPFVSGGELRSRGLSGADIPSFNFAPAVGFYQKLIESERSKPKT